MADNESGEHTHVRCRAIIEILGKPKDYVENSIKRYVDHIKNDSELIVLNQEFSQTKEQGPMFSQFVELDIVIKGTKKLISFCFEYMPSSIEVIKPENFSLNSGELSNFVNDLMARLHNVDMIVKQQKVEADFLKQNMNTIIKNAMIIGLKFGRMNIEQLSRITGVSKNELELFANELVSGNRVKKDGDFYILANGKN